MLKIAWKDQTMEGLFHCQGQLHFEDDAQKGLKWVNKQLSALSKEMWTEHC